MNYVNYDIDPFITARLPPMRSRNIDVPVETVIRMRDMVLEDRNQIICRDVWMLSYYLCGINIGDMMSLDLRGDDVYFVRKKTQNSAGGGHQISFKICDEAREIIDRYMNPENGRLVFGRYRDKVQVVNLMRRHLHSLKEKLGIRKSFMLYSARKSFAKHAYDLGVNDKTIDYCLGHTVHMNVSFNSYVTVGKRHADRAIDIVMGNLRYPSDNLFV